MLNNSSKRESTREEVQKKIESLPDFIPEAKKEEIAEKEEMAEPVAANNIEPMSIEETNYILKQINDYLEQEKSNLEKGE